MSFQSCNKNIFINIADLTPGVPRPTLRTAVLGNSFYNNSWKLMCHLHIVQLTVINTTCSAIYHLALMWHSSKVLA